MNGLYGFRLSVALSLSIHLAFFIIASITLKKTLPQTPSCYSISLIAEDSSEVASVSEQPNEVVRVATDAGTDKADLSEYLSSRLGEIKEKESEKRYIAEKLSAMRAKALIKNTPVSGTSGTSGTSGNQSIALASKPSDGVSDAYVKTVKDIIWREWVFPGDKTGLKSVVSITILKDGTIKINGIDTTSGNANFDRSCLKAINRASPLPAPPCEMEIGLRFSQ